MGGYVKMLDEREAPVDVALRGVPGDQPVILLAHEGGFCEQSGCNGEIFDLAKQLPAGSVDLIVAGHTHVKLATEVNGVPIVEARSSGAAIGVTDLVRRADGGVEEIAVDEPRASAPCLDEGRLDSLHVSLRVFAVAVGAHMVWDMSFELPLYLKYVLLGKGRFVPDDKRHQSHYRNEAQAARSQMVSPCCWKIFDRTIRQQETSASGFYPARTRYPGLK